MRDSVTGRIGTFQANFVVPNLNREEKRIPISTVVLSSQRVPFNEAIYTVAGGVAVSGAVAAIDHSNASSNAQSTSSSVTDQ